MVEQSRKEFIQNLKQLMHFFNNLKDASKQTDEMKADLFKKDISSPKEKIGFEFKFETNPFDKAVLERK